MKNKLRFLALVALATAWAGAASAELKAPERTCESFYNKCQAKARSIVKQREQQNAQSPAPASMSKNDIAQPGICEDAWRFAKDKGQWPGNLEGMTLPGNVTCTN